MYNINTIKPNINNSYDVRVLISQEYNVKTQISWSRFVLTTVQQNITDTKLRQNELINADVTKQREVLAYKIHRMSILIVVN